MSSKKITVLLIEHDYEIDKIVAALKFQPNVHNVKVINEIDLDAWFALQQYFAPIMR